MIRHLSLLCLLLGGCASDSAPRDATAIDAITDAQSSPCVSRPNQCYDVSAAEAALMIEDLCKPAINLCEWDYFRYWLGEGQCVTYCCPEYAGNPLFECRYTCGTDEPPPAYPPGNCDHLVRDAGVPGDVRLLRPKTDNWLEEIQ